MSKKDERRDALLRFIRRRSGRRFSVAVMAREFGVSERTIQSDLSVLEVFGQIKRTPSYNSLHRQNGNIIVYTGAASGNLINRTTDNFDLLRGEVKTNENEAKRPILWNRIRSETQTESHLHFKTIGIPDFFGQVGCKFACLSF